MTAGEIKTIPTVEIPLDEYKEFMAWQIKGPTIELPLEDYDRLKSENEELKSRLFEAERHIRTMENELDNEQRRMEEWQDEIDGHTDVVTRMVADEITEKIMKDLLCLTDGQKKQLRSMWQEKKVSDSDTKHKESEVVKNGRI